MVALYFDGSILGGATRSATLLELSPQLFEFRRIQGNTADNGNTLTLPAFSLARNTHNSIRLWDGPDFCAAASIERISALSTHAAKLRGVNQPRAAFLV